MTGEELRKLCAGRNICQIGIMCEDIYKTMDTLINVFHLGPWDFYTHSEKTLQDPIIVEGLCEPSFQFYCAVASVGNIQIELIQPLYGIPFYFDFLAKHGTGLHHFKEKVPSEDFDATVQKYADMGMKPLFGARLFESRFTFVNTLEKFGFYLEIGNGQSPSSVPAEWKKVYPSA